MSNDNVTWSATLQSLFPPGDHGSMDESSYMQLQERASAVVECVGNEITYPEYRAFILRCGLNESNIQTLYTSNEIYRQLNLALFRQLTDSNGHRLSSEQFRAVSMTMKLMGEVVTRQIQFDLPSNVYRGVFFWPSLLKKYSTRLGEVVFFYGFTSTSRNRSLAEQFRQFSTCHV